MEEQVANNPVQQEPVNPAPVNKKPEQWIIAGIIFVLLLIFGTIYVRNLPLRKPVSPPPKPLISPLPISPTPTPIVIPTTESSITANWKTFIGIDKSFSFKYPKEWQDPSMSSLSTRTSYMFPSNMTVEVGMNYNQELNGPLSYEEELKEMQKHAISSKDITIAGIKTKKYLQKMTSIYTGGIVILKGKDARDIIWMRMPFYQETDENTFDRILSTFKFTDQAANSAKNYCNFLTQKNETIESVWDCGDYKVLKRSCCDFLDIILDKNGNEIMQCGGIRGYSKECNKFGNSPKSCSETRCSDK